MTVNFEKQALRDAITSWLKEDVGSGDVTSLWTIPEDHQSLGIIHAKESGVIAGLFAAEEVFQTVHPDLKFEAKAADGAEVQKGDVIAIVEGDTRAILTGERLALNLLQRMSGIATKTRSFVEALQGLPVRLVDTRKTTPGHRMLEKYAVRVGGGANHRFGLYDAVMIKDNHIKASGGIEQAVSRARENIPHTMKIEVETETMDQVKEAVGAQADIIMLDNMDLAQMREAVQYIKSTSAHIIVEASGGVRLDTIEQIARTGVDVISVGSLTSSVQSLDISLDLNEKKRGNI